MQVEMAAKTGVVRPKDDSSAHGRFEMFK